MKIEINIINLDGTKVTNWGTVEDMIESDLYLLEKIPPHNTTIINMRNLILTKD